MTRNFAIAAIAFALATPALANDKLAGSVGVEPGQFTLNELASLKAAQDGDDRIAFGFEGGSEIVSTQSIDMDRSDDGRKAGIISDDD
ncbi:hypothetical protein [Pseudaestuariivita rosea]|uniref:hypothetical protein n=1 Tax=Pseudaestuariivita rosea TaxID=2763263 RepID=UPI001ABBA236|nr:hypothetical protein [Pseudaestuariivita rosea]